MQGVADGHAGGKTWIDLMAAGEARRQEVGTALGLELPTAADLAEIENSSRLYAEAGAVFVNLPLLTPWRHGQPARTAPVGFVLTATHLVTVREEETPAFDAAVVKLRAAEGRGCGSTELFVTVLEEIAEQSADVMERVGVEIDGVSNMLFSEGGGPIDSAGLRDVLKSIGRMGELLAKLRNSLLMASRAVPFLPAHAPWLPEELRPRLETVRGDLVSLMDHDGHLAERVRFLHDAALGLINLEQSNIIKIMTVVSVVAMPPTLIASIYGMNFKVMPELDWAWGYPYALGLIVVSVVIPLLWFRARRWL
jgi:magnesium transporter